MNNKMLKIRNVGVAICSFVLVCMFIALIITRIGNKDNSKLDLDDFSINGLTEEQKIKIANSYNATLTTWINSGKRSGFRGYTYEDEDHDETYFKAKKATGIKTVNATSVENCAVEWEIDCTVTKGAAKIIIVMDENSILKEFEPNTDKITFSYFAEGKHSFFVKILCEEAKIEIETKRFIRQH